MITEKFFCGNIYCSNFGIQGFDNRIVLAGYDKGIQRIRCQICGHRFSSRLGTIFYHIKDDEEVIERTINCLAEGVGLRSSGRINKVDKDTVCYWLYRAGEHCAGVLNKFFINLHLTECQLDELWSFIYCKEHNLQNLETILEEYGDVWIWVAFAPNFKIIPAFVVGKRSQENCDLLIEKLLNVSDGNILG
jgi:transposase-like protein